MASAAQTYPPTLLKQKVLSEAVRTLARFGRIRYDLSVDSTNARALEEIHKQDALGISFVTESQQTGRGRAGRLWVSPVGAGLYCSTILPAGVTNRTLPAINFWAALAVASAIREVADVAVDYKWPNDLLVGSAKCCGILAEGRSVGELSRVVVGVGINVNRPAIEDSAALAIIERAGFLSDAAGHAIDRTELLIALLREYERSFDELLDDPVAVVRRWAQAARLAHGRTFAVRDASGALLHEGIALGVADDGALLLQTRSGPVTVRLGDVDALD